MAYEMQTEDAEMQIRSTSYGTVHWCMKFH
jgi:hypothetical protein